MTFFEIPHQYRLHIMISFQDMHLLLKMIASYYETPCTIRDAARCVMFNGNKSYMKYKKMAEDRCLIPATELS